MKKNRLVLLLAPLVFSSLTGCSFNEEISLTFGTQISQSINSLEVISNEELLSKANNGEVFLLAAYQGQYSEDCLCWTTFQNIIVRYTNTFNEIVYVYNAQAQNESVAELNIEKLEESSPALYIFQGNKQLAKFSEKNSKDSAIFSDTTAVAMNSRVHKVVKKPKAYFIDDEFYEDQIELQEQTIVFFIRSKCGDCSYVLPNVIIPYINSHRINKNVWIIDMQGAYENKDNGFDYQALKDKYGLSVSGNATFGYGEGVVPTAQYYENGIIKDASVYFNDKVEKKDDGSYYVSDSYYTEERLPNLKYLKDVKNTTILKGMSLDESCVLETPSGGYYWAQENAANYHTPLLKSFLDYYLL